MTLKPRYAYLVYSDPCSRAKYSTNTPKSHTIMMRIENSKDTRFRHPLRRTDSASHPDMLMLFMHSSQMGLLASLRRLHSAQSTALADGVGRALRRVDQPAGLHHIDGPRPGPLVDLLPVLALVRGGVGDGDERCWGPLEGNDTNVGVAYGCLSEEVEAVF
jgi:hypothetical protein